MDFQHITVAGSGVLGSQIAFQTAFKGFEVSVYDINDEAIEKAKGRFQELMKRYQGDLGASEADVRAAYERISYYTDLAEAVRDADLVIEAVPEVADIKMEFYKKLGQCAPEKTIFATNTSTMLPSQFAEATGRPEKFLALHFANEIWLHNTAEVMKHPGTDEKVFQAVIEFARAIGMVPLPLHKEQPGYILNSLLVPFLDAAQSLYIRDVADPEIIDKTWMIATGSPKGPFAIMDVVGINTVYNIVSAKAKAGDEEARRLAERLKTEFIDQGKLGVTTGEGFYRYPNPRYEDPDFLKE
ncbi:3-hydroxyacyl-CoA dehydrogenase [Anoxybacillus geothermalis]|uniref:3-hydroxyacyl-CoA dehydrogenase n=1 Tax=Geobacillus TaxID=129337 RepID=UPI00067C3685|nr:MULTISPECIES: 3-hydroxyacyl-CoA dehydrogenase [Geobacillus]AKU27055.1 3-hydroxybutyryl-CoA dehydrogenase [Geobacillus sp. LC300]ATA58838.1 3-hydroxyacyl-CoA dehydrogenase [Geobacillus stearothermophilus]MED0655378.1 3-hydroxyacyl-CoA dehydrogenase [Anoxybacillus geothermalis]NNV00434.1 3-hydroxyacyl-CoA dehydrogenase [Geobacillus sp. DSP4a]OQP16245.1 3-hydroxybutyryl-CoA dehydrogenase [Geobacillus zalihae]